MSVSVSTNYRELTHAEAEVLAGVYDKAWQDPEIPRRQYESVVKPELEWFRSGNKVAPFDALVKCLTNKMWFNTLKPTMLDVGASGGYYSEIVHSVYPFDYTGCDYSEAFQRLAGELYPGIKFDVADARALPYESESFDIVLSGAAIMHIAEYELAIAEAARVASKYVIFHRTPVLTDAATKFFEKEAYGVRCLEIHFNKSELAALFEANELDPVHSEEVFWNHAERFGHMTYLLKKHSLSEREWERA